MSGVGARLFVKIGGSTLGSHDTTIADLAALQRNGFSPVVIHGGGKTITDWLGKQGVPTRFVRGLRVTDADSLKVAVAVLAGLVNKELVAQINSLGGRAIGFCGADGRLIEARVRDPELGMVGDVVRFNLGLVKAVLSAGYMPVIAPVGLEEGEAGANGSAGKLLNINADAVAGGIAAALGGDRLVFLTDVEGILDKAGSLVPSLDEAGAQELIAAGVISGGMLPKVEACLRSLAGVTSACIIDGRKSHALLEDVGRGAVAGTRFGRC
ncbi:MAG: acetylglutamate kinase [Chloroflexi bacterium]|nr:acetylglutamate kinase [Chloroflexota bacterium]